MTASFERLRMVAASPMPEELSGWMERLEPRLELVRDHELVRAMRHPCDHDGDSSWCPTPDLQHHVDRLVGSTQAQYGIPDAGPAALARAVRANPQSLWTQTTASGSAVQVFGAGLSTLELERVWLTTSAGVRAGPLAEFVLLGLLAGAKGRPRLMADHAGRVWAEGHPLSQVASQTVLVLGAGHVAQAVVRQLSFFGVRVIVANRTVRDCPGAERIVPFSELALEAHDADALVVTLPNASTTRALVGAAVLGRLRHGATVVNVGCGSVVDEPALIAALISGQVGFVALDVTDSKPLSPGSPLWDLPNVLLSPHTAALSEQEDRLIAALAIENATRLLDGCPLGNIIDICDLV